MSSSAEMVAHVDEKAVPKGEACSWSDFACAELRWADPGHAGNYVKVFVPMDEKTMIAWAEAFHKVADDLCAIICERFGVDVAAKRRQVANVEPLPELEMVPPPVDFPGYVTDPYSGASVPVSPPKTLPPARPTGNSCVCGGR
jgi:hypothetical protein